MVSGVGQFVRHDRSHSLLQREVDFAALATELPRQQRRHACRCAQHPRHQLTQRGVGRERWLPGRILHAVGDSGSGEGQPACRHCCQLVAHVGTVRPGQAKGRDGGDYQAGIELREGLAAQTLPPYLGTLSAHDQDIGPCNQLVKRGFLR